MTALRVLVPIAEAIIMVVPFTCVFVLMISLLFLHMYFNTSRVAVLSP